MAFKDFDDIARRGLKRASIPDGSVALRSEFPRKGSPSTVIRFTSSVTEKAGWQNNVDRIRLEIDHDDRVVRASVADHGGYKLMTPRKGNKYLKFTVAEGMPITEAFCVIEDVIVAGGVVMFTVPDEIRFQKI